MDVETGFLASGGFAENADDRDLRVGNGGTVSFVARISRQRCFVGFLRTQIGVPTMQRLAWSTVVPRNADSVSSKPGIGLDM